jgi:hypothetical protein
MIKLNFTNIELALKATLKKLLYFFLKAIIIIFFLFYRFYSSDALEGFVYDAETNQPLEGVEVEITWTVDYGTILHMTSTIESFRTKTNKNGYFYFPAWGPKIDKRREISKGAILSLYKKNYEKKYLDHDLQYYHNYLFFGYFDDYLFFNSWIIIGDPPWYNRGEKTIRLKKLKPNVKK